MEGRSSDDYDVARSLIAYLKQSGQDLDASLTPEQRAQLLAYTALIQAKLEPASVYTTWCERESYSLHTQVRFTIEIAHDTAMSSSFHGYLANG